MIFSKSKLLRLEELLPGEIFPAAAAIKRARGRCGAGNAQPYPAQCHQELRIHEGDFPGEKGVGDKTGTAFITK